MPDTSSAEFENALYTLGGVVSARVTSSAPDHLGISLLVAPASDTNHLVEEVAGMARALLPEPVPAMSLQVVSLGEDRQPLVVDLDQAVRRPEEGGAGVGAGVGRVAFRSVLAITSGPVFRTEVSLAGGGEVVGTASGTTASSAVPRLVAEATLDALVKATALGTYYVEDAAVVDLAHRRVAVVVLVLPTPDGEDVLVGAAIVRSTGPMDAVARAVLDAVNRRLAGAHPVAGT